MPRPPCAVVAVASLFATGSDAYALVSRPLPGSVGLHLQGNFGALLVEGDASSGRAKTPHGACTCRSRASARGGIPVMSAGTDGPAWFDVWEDDVTTDTSSTATATLQQGVELRGIAELAAFLKQHPPSLPPGDEVPEDILG